jgi:hypothetical protein
MVLDGESEPASSEAGLIPGKSHCPVDLAAGTDPSVGKTTDARLEFRW